MTIASCSGVWRKLALRWNLAHRKHGVIELAPVVARHIEALVKHRYPDSTPLTNESEAIERIRSDWRAVVCFMDLHSVMAHRCMLNGERVTSKLKPDMRVFTCDLYGDPVIPREHYGLDIDPAIHPLSIM